MSTKPDAATLRDAVFDSRINGQQWVLPECVALGDRNLWPRSGGSTRQFIWTTATASPSAMLSATDCGR